MIRRSLGLALAVLMLSTMAGGDMAVGKERVSTDVDATYVYPDDLSGDVDAKGRCDSKRTVKATHINGQTGDKTPAGSDKTDRSGDWALDPSVTPVPGDFWLITVLALTLQAQVSILCSRARVRIAA